MILSPTGIVPEALMYPARLGDVMRLLGTLAADGETKEALFLGWARTVGVKVNASQRATVRQSGWDFSGGTELSSTAPTT